MKEIKIKEKFLELRAQGLSFYKIAQELNVSKQTLINWSKELKIELDNLKSIELDKLQREYSITRTERLKLFAEKLKSIKQELNNRNIQALSTEKLFDYLLKFSHALKNEESEIVFQKISPRSFGEIEYITEIIEKWNA